MICQDMSEWNRTSELLREGPKIIIVIGLRFSACFTFDLFTDQVPGYLRAKASNVVFPPFVKGGMMNYEQCKALRSRGMC